MTEQAFVSNPAFWAAIVGGITGVTGVVVGRKSRPLDEADVATRIGEAWDRLVEQLNIRNEQILRDNEAIHRENESLRKEVAMLKARADRCEAGSIAMSKRMDGLVAYLTSLGLEAPPEVLEERNHGI